MAPEAMTLDRFKQPTRRRAAAAAAPSANWFRPAQHADRPISDSTASGVAPPEATGTLRGLIYAIPACALFWTAVLAVTVS